MAGDAEQERSRYSAMNEKTVMMVRSLEDSLAHWCTIDQRDRSKDRDLAEHQ